MEQLNDNNFLIWKGAFNNVPAELEAVNDTIFMNIEEDFATLYPLDNDTSNYGIDYSSFAITYDDNPSRPARFNNGSGLFKYFPRLPLINGQTRLLRYKWKDIKGNLSNEATISILITNRPLGWRIVSESGYCIVNSNLQNTGYVGYTQLERYFSDTNEAVSPPQVKKNISSDPDYLAPVFNETICPIGGTASVVQFITEKPFVDGGNAHAVFFTDQRFTNPDTGVNIFTFYCNPYLASQSFEFTPGTYTIELWIQKGIASGTTKIKILASDDSVIADITTDSNIFYTIPNITIGALGCRIIIY